MPATVLQAGTSLRTTDPAAIREQWPMRIFPRTFAPAPISTPTAAADAKVTGFICIEPASGLDPVTVDGLLEIQMPDWDGRPGEEVERIFREARQRTPQQWWDGLAGGESFGHFHDRVAATTAEELEARGVRRDDAGRLHLWHVKDTGSRIAIVAHAGTNSVALGWLLDVAPAPWEWERFVLGHCSLARVKSVGIAGANAFSLRSFNDQEHLPENLRTR